MALVVQLRHRQRWRSTNLLDRPLGEVRRRTKVIGRSPGETSCLSLIWAVLDLIISHATNGATFTDLDRQHLYQPRYQSPEHSTLEDVTAAETQTRPVAVALREHPDGEIFLSPFRDPRSVVTAAELLSEIGDCRARYPTRDALAADAGQAAVAVESGKRKTASFLLGCNKRLRSAFCTLADSTRPWHQLAQDRYAAARASSTTTTRARCAPVAAPDTCGPRSGPANRRRRRGSPAETGRPL
jgi:hypothetical protein